MFNTATSDPKDTLLLGMDRNSPFIADRRRIEIKQRGRFYSDVNEIRILERVSFGVEHPEVLGGIADIQNATR